MTGRATAVPGRPLPVAASWTFLGLGVACAGLYIAAPESAVGMAGAGAVPIGAMAAVSLGVRGNRPADPRPWRLVLAGMVLAFLGAVVRSAVGSEGLAGDAFALAAYPLFFAWLFSLQRARNRDAEADAVADGVLVGVGALLLVWTLFVSPAISVQGAPLATRVVESLYPVLDAVLLFTILRIAFVSWGQMALWFGAAGFGFLLGGDLLWMVNAVRPLGLSPMVFEAPYLGCYLMVGAAALHPSMRALTDPVQASVRPLPRGRLFALSLAVAVPAVLVLLRPLHQALDRAAVAAGLLLLAGVVLWRTIRAVNRHAASELRLAHLATHDDLTGLPNRVRLVERLTEALADLTGGRRTGEVAVLFCDLDGFKFVNDTWGHSVGDELLCAVGARLSEIRQHEDLVTRVGGDEFVLTCVAPDAESSAVRLARRVLSQVATPFLLSTGEVYVTASIGIALAGNHLGPTAPEELIRDADIAMYRAKGEGRNRLAIFDESMRTTVQHRMRTEVEMRRALERGELLVHYQPIVSVVDGHVRGLEALVRWDHPERGLVPPGDFVGIVEETDLILPLGEFVLRSAAQQVRRWRDELEGGESLMVSVNVAARQFRDPSFVPMVRAVLTEYDLPGHALTLEITEGTMVDDSQATHNRFLAIRELGVGISVDDFGTGYSSLKYLKKFPVTTVKIDRAFVDGLGTDPDDEVIVKAVLAMGHALGLEVVAEGVETVSQRDRLIALGVDAAQGYLFGRPAPASSPPLRAHPVIEPAPAP